MSDEPSLQQALEATQHELRLARAELEGRRALEAPRPSPWTIASMARLTLLLIVLAGLLGTGAGIFIFLFPDLSAEYFAWVLQKLCDLLLGRRC